MQKRFRMKYLKSSDIWVLHVQKIIKQKKVWRRVWGYTFATESLARTFAAGNF